MIDFGLIVGFEWDSGNQRKNELKHCVSSAEAEEVFFNSPLLISMDDKPKSPAINPPSSPNAVAAAPERTESRAEKSIKDIESRFKQTGSSSDFIALRAAQISKRKT